MYIVVGLGNPSSQYTGTRHNIGFDIVDQLAAEHDTDIRRPEYQALTAKTEICRTEVLLMKPQTFMNLSGRAVGEACRDARISPDQVIVAYDDADLDFGRLRLRRGGGSGGHNGIKSIADALDEPTFLRVRAGIGRPRGNMDLSDYVLAKFRRSEQAEAKDLTDRATTAIRDIIEHGIERAMQIHNGL